jgi:hypothetical protein
MVTEMPELRAMKVMRNPAVTRDDVYRVISRYPFQFPTRLLNAETEKPEAGVAVGLHRPRQAPVDVIS